MAVLLKRYDKKEEKRRITSSVFCDIHDFATSETNTDLRDD